MRETAIVRRDIFAAPSSVARVDIGKVNARRYRESRESGKLKLR